MKKTTNFFSARVRLTIFGAVLCVCGLFAAGCSKSDPAASLPANRPAAIPSGNLPADVRITFERTAADSPLGYKLEIAPDRTLVFEVTYYHDKSQLKKTTARITEDQLRALVDEFRKADFFALNDSYQKNDECPARWTDNPTMITSLRIDGREKRIVRDGGCRDKERRPYPPALAALEDRIDEILDTKQWFPK
ncbi:MAG: hypothetical protein JSS81_13470 [Acidobacteria bacterium]|nr:hypothetical protein [Acidobacteriota bacterium]